MNPAYAALAEAIMRRQSQPRGRTPPMATRTCLFSVAW